MRKRGFLCLILSAILLLAGCSYSASDYLELRLSDKKISPADQEAVRETEENTQASQEDASSASASETSGAPETEALTSTLETETAEPAETEPTSTLAPATEPPAPATAPTEPPTTAAPTAPPTAAPTTTAAPATTAPSTTAPPTTTPPETDAPETTAPALVLEEAYQAGRIFYEGEYVKRLFSGANAGGTPLNTSDLTFSPERLNRTGTVTVQITYGSYTAERTFNVVSGSQLVPTAYELGLFGHGRYFLLGTVLSAKEVYENEYDMYYTEHQYDNSQLINRPLITDVIPDEEFLIEPSVVTEYPFQNITITCRGVSVNLRLDVYPPQ